ncbi:hypothetical protein P0F65_07320 [Sphingomonas sp. I4]
MKTSVIMNSGFFPAGANPIPGIVSDKALLKRLHGSTLYILGARAISRTATAPMISAGSRIFQRP